MILRPLPRLFFLGLVSLPHRCVKGLKYTPLLKQNFKFDVTKIFMTKITIIGYVKNLKNMHSICYLPLRTIVIATGDKTIEYCNMQHCNNAILFFIEKMGNQQATLCFMASFLGEPIFRH